MWNLTIWKIPQSCWECNLQSQYDCKGWPSFGNYPYKKYHNLIENVLYNLNMIAKVDHYVIMENTTISLRMHFTISIRLQRLTNNLKMCQLGKPSIKKMVKLGKKSKLNIQSKLSKFGKKPLEVWTFSHVPPFFYWRLPLYMLKWKIPQSCWECSLQSQYDCKGWPTIWKCVNWGSLH